LLRRLFERFGLGKPAKKTVSTVRLEVVAEKVRQFNEAKQEINDKIHTLEERTDRLDNTLSETLEATRNNQRRLTNIEENMQKIADMSEALIAARQKTGESEGAQEQETEGNI
jgi:uncharacterized protein Yka (UPF0111/DUF47 family)